MFPTGLGEWMRNDPAKRSVRTAEMNSRVTRCKDMPKAQVTRRTMLAPIVAGQGHPTRCSAECRRQRAKATDERRDCGAGESMAVVRVGSRWREVKVRARSYAGTARHAQRGPRATINSNGKQAQQTRGQRQAERQANVTAGNCIFMQNLTRLCIFYANRNRKRYCKPKILRASAAAPDYFLVFLTQSSPSTPDFAVFISYLVTL